MKRNNQAGPFNPFVNIRHDSLADIDPSAVLTLPPGHVPYSADGIEDMADEMDWSDPELEALRDAAQFVRWTSRQHNLPEATVIRHRTSFRDGMSLVLRNVGKEINVKGDK